MKAYLKGMRLAIFTLLVVGLITSTLFADASTGWRGFNLGVQGGLSDGIFSLEKFEFNRLGDVSAEVKIKNIGKEDASVALSIALFDSEKSLLTSVCFTPHFLRPRDTEHAILELPGSGEVFSKIKYYQLSIVERREKE
ncbi:MAG: hypothetical protein Q6354_01275 [Candidatus Brocadiales bacterium]|nr:hypothetical protein [Candidatus Brocadiales bacterium]